MAATALRAAAVEVAVPEPRPKAATAVLAEQVL
jgi:hypothetical protein